MSVMIRGQGRTRLKVMGDVTPVGPLAQRGRPTLGPHRSFRLTLQVEVITKKYRLCRYILGVLTHTAAWNQQWGGDETLILVLINVA